MEGKVKKVENKAKTKGGVTVKFRKRLFYLPIQSATARFNRPSRQATN